MQLDGVDLFINAYRVIGVDFDPFLATGKYTRGLFAVTMFFIGWLLPRDELQQVIQRPAAFFARVRHSHGISSRLFQDRQHPPDQPRDRRIADPEQVTQYLVGRIDP